MKHIGVPYRWAQVLCGLYYGNRSEGKVASSGNASIDEELGHKVNGKNGSQMDEEMIEVDTEDDKDDFEESDDGGEFGDLEVIQLKTRNESKFIVQILNRLKSRFKARVILQKTLNSTSKNSRLRYLDCHESFVMCEKVVHCSYIPGDRSFGNFGH